MNETLESPSKDLLSLRLKTLADIGRTIDAELSNESIASVLASFGTGMGARNVWLWMQPGVLLPHHQWDADPSAERSPPTISSDLLARAIDAKGEYMEGPVSFVPLSLSNGELFLLGYSLSRTRTEDDLSHCSIVARALSRYLDRTRVHRDLVRARDEAEQATAMKSTFLATMSHEVRTPLNAVIGLMDLLMEGGKLGSEQREYVMLAQAAGKDLLRIVSDILDFSKVEAGQLELEVIQFDLFALIKRMVKLTSASALQKNVEIEVDFAHDVTRWCKGDPIRLGQILNNLLSNAVKFTERGIVRVRVTRRRDNLRIDVSDSGVGIDATTLTRLFQPFRQADESTTRKYGGTGLGLAIAKALLERMNGEIYVNSELGKGSTFWFSVPLPACEEIDDAPESERVVFDAPPATQKVFSRPILVAEDNPVNQRLMRGFLQHLGFKVVEVESGDAAIDEYRRGGEFAAIFMDWQMPGCDGIAATQRIRTIERAERRAHVPIIGLSANALAGDREQCMNAGMDEYLTKPIRFEQLRTTLTRWVRTDEEQASSSLDLVSLYETLGTDEQDVELAREVIGIFLEDSERRVEHMGRCVEQNEMLDLAKQAHALKGSSGNIAANTLARLSADLEKFARSGDGLGANRLFGEFRKEYENVRRDCRAYLAKDHGNRN